MKRVLAPLLGAIFAASSVGTAIAAPAEEVNTSAAIPAAIPASPLDKVSAWQDMKFGLFLHWGVYSSYAGWYKGKKQEVGYPEQIKAWGAHDTYSDWETPIPREEYLATAQTFDAPEFDAQRWCSAAKDAGMRYLLITSKHHDGFAMWDTATTDYSFTAQSPSGRDPLKELSTACQEVGIEFALYFSNIDWEWQPSSPWMNDNPLIEEGYMDFIHAQLEELLGGDYGQIAEVWFDMGAPTPEQSQQLADWVHELQPNAMVNSRVWNDRGDFEVGWDNALQTNRALGPWESARSIHPDCWGYCAWDDVPATFTDSVSGRVRTSHNSRIRLEEGGLERKTSEEIINLVNTVALGGQYLLNTGPRFDGSFDPWDAEVLANIGTWNRTHPGILTASRPTYFPIEEWGKTMVDDSTIYLAVEKWTDGEEIVLKGAGVNDIQSIVLEGSDAHVAHRVEGSDLFLTLPARPLDDPLPVIAVKTAGTPLYLPVGLTSITSEETVTIPAEDTEVVMSPKVVNGRSTGPAQVIASVISPERRATGVAVAVDSETLGDDYSRYRLTVGDQVRTGLTSADLRAGVPGFVLEPNTTNRILLEFDDPSYALAGFGYNAQVSAFTVTASAFESPTAIVDPTRVARDGRFSVKGAGFTPGHEIRLELHSDPIDLGTAVADENGAVSFTNLTVPPSLELGEHTATLTDLESGVSAESAFTVIPAAAPTPDPGASEDPGSKPVPSPTTATLSTARGSSEATSPKGLAATGSPVILIAFVGLIASGAGAFLLARRRA